MKLPAVAIASAVAVVLLLLIAARFLPWRDLICGASGVSLAAWLLLGAFRRVHRKSTAASGTHSAAPGGSGNPGEKVGHHGSKNSTGPDFRNAVAPQVSIISPGEENPYGHPSLESLGRPDETGTRVFRADQDGAVQVLTDGHDLQVRCLCSGRTPALTRAQPPNQNQAEQQ
jgi:hypothetical protein